MFTPVKRNNVVYADPFNHIFESFFGDANRCKPAPARLAPQFEIVETDDHYTVVAELPGIGKENVEIVVDENVLTVKGEKKAEERTEEKSYLFSERRYGSFERKFKLPDTVDQEAIKAGYENGVLTLTLPKKPEAKKPEPRRIEVKA
ncbi:Spore protein SP21 [Pontiella desulfatans]|uniref:Spore protein SP21 n=1 Tax=Pontiella desulfatans TaxID=2750659 RepID=A0A6C2UBV6_PONDE|nr:Hsp20/alpha crystallin family protein [Pontiella desulfatans]VGO16844.1 Spore protein SP21 [Pontiella desulfatans]